MMRERERGMTLLEMLVALAIFAIIGAALYPVLFGAIASRRDATGRMHLYSEARAILDRVEQDLRSSIDSGYPPALLPRFVAPPSAGRGFAEERVIVELTTLVARGVTSSDAFVGGEEVGALAIDRGDQAHVLWRIDASGNLVRQEVRPPGVVAVDWTTAPSETLVDDADVRLEFLDAPSSGGSAAWLDGWDSSEGGPYRGRAPLLVRTTVTVDDQKGEPVVLVSTVVLPTIEAPPAPSGSGHSKDTSK
jgi:prepilin-type N-terminal cleavage/methylation domain-containing protein